MISLQVQKHFDANKGIYGSANMSYGTVTVYLAKPKKQVQGGTWILPAVLLSRLDHVQRKPLIKHNSVSTRQNVTRHWIVWILSDSPVSPCLEIPDGPLSVGFSISWNEALGESG